MDAMEIAKRIGQARKEAGMTLQQVAEATGVARSTVQRYEQGRIANVKMPVVQAIARALEVNPDWLTGASESKVPGPGFDDFTYALHRETKELTQENREKLLEMARIFRAAQQADKEN